MSVLIKKFKPHKKCSSRNRRVLLPDRQKYDQQKWIRKNERFFPDSVLIPGRSHSLVAWLCLLAHMHQTPLSMREQRQKKARSKKSLHNLLLIKYINVFINNGMFHARANRDAYLYKHANAYGWMGPKSSSRILKSFLKGFRFIFN